MNTSLRNCLARGDSESLVCSVGLSILQMALYASTDMCRHNHELLGCGQGIPQSSSHKFQGLVAPSSDKKTPTWPSELLLCFLHSIGATQMAKKCLGGFVTRCLISGNQFLSGWKDVIIIRSPPHFTSLPRTSWMMVPKGKVQCVQLLENRSTTGVPQHLNTCSWLGLLSSTHELSRPWIGYLPRGLPQPWDILTIPLPHSCDIWARSPPQDHLGSCNQFLPPSINRPMLLCCLSGRRLSSPSLRPPTFDRLSTLFLVPGYWCRFFCPSFLGDICCDYLLY